MLRNIAQITIVFSALFLLLSLFLKPFQLMGLTDQGYWINFFYNVINNGESVTSLNNRHNFLEHSLLLFISPLAFIKEPLYLSYVLYYLTYLSWFLTFYILLFGQFEFKKVIKSFSLFFCSTTLLFHYALNYNGWNSIYIAPAILMLSYYYAFNKSQYKKSILMYVPLLFLKIQFWLIFPFLLTSIYLHSRKIKYLIFAFLFTLIFLIYIFVRPYIFGESTTAMLLDQAYSHILSRDFKIFFDVFFKNISIKLVLILAFFAQFIFLINFKNIKKNDAFIAVLLILPIFLYCILSSRTVMSYWTHEHYVLPVLPVVFFIFLKYGIVTKSRIILFVILNLCLITGIISLKEPWQYKYYQDEVQLENDIKPLMTIENYDHILADDRTGLYFANTQVNFLKYIEDNSRQPKYIILNLRYLYYINNLQRHKTNDELSSFEFVDSYEQKMNGYGILYLNFPFVVYEKNLKSNLEIQLNELNNWDQQILIDNRFRFLEN
jgi:hypothetical protein